MNKHNLVVGKYYTFKSGSDISYWFRFKEIKANFLYCSGFRSDYSSKIWQEEETKLLYIKNEIFTEVTEQEAKGIVEKKEDQWKVGGWVKVLSSTYSTNPFKIGSYYQIASISATGNLFLITETFPEGLCMYPSECEWVGMNKPEEIPNNTPDSNTQYWECINNGLVKGFTEGRIYKLSEGKSIYDSYAFIDDFGLGNGFSENNKKHFKPSTEAAYNAQNQCVMYKGDLTQNYTYSNWKIAEDNSFVWKSTININTLNNPITITIKDRTKKEQPKQQKRAKLTILKPKSITI